MYCACVRGGAGNRKCFDMLLIYFSNVVDRLVW